MHAATDSSRELGDAVAGCRECVSAPHDPHILTFRYVWTLRVVKRKMACGDDAILHVSLPFCTAFNGCQFTWILRMCDENILEMASIESFEDSDRPRQSQRVNVTLYYKHGPTQDVTLASASISAVVTQTEQVILGTTPLEGHDYTLGSGWSPAGSHEDDAWLAFSEFVHANVGTQISVCVELGIRSSWFQPLKYLPEVENANKLEAVCEQMLQTIFADLSVIPDIGYYDVKEDKYAYHRHVFNFACREIQKRLDGSLCTQMSPDKIQTVCAHVYFNRVIMEDTTCFEDFVDILEASSAVHFPALKRECERFICREVMVESADEDFVKKMLLLAERFDLPVLKMVSSGALVDKLLDKNEGAAMRKDLLQIAEQIPTTDDESDGEGDSENVHLVHNLVNHLESMAKNIRRVSLSASCSNLDSTSPTRSSFGSASSSSAIFVAAPQPRGVLPNAGQMPSAGRRNSLKTSRELLTFSTSLEGDTSPAFRRHGESLFNSGLDHCCFEDDEADDSESDSSRHRSPAEQLPRQVKVHP